MFKYSIILYRSCVIVNQLFASFWFIVVPKSNFGSLYPLSYGSNQQMSVCLHTQLILMPKDPNCELLG